MTKRIVSGIFILTALGALGVILAGALTSGEQLIVRFLTAVIVAALGLYVISDLRLQADDDAKGARSTGQARRTGIDAPPNSTAAFMATVTRKGDSKGGTLQVAIDQDAPAEDERIDPHQEGVGTTSSSTSEQYESAVVEDAGSLDGPPVPSILGSAPVTVRASELPALTGLRSTTITDLAADPADLEANHGVAPWPSHHTGEILSNGSAQADTSPETTAGDDGSPGDHSGTSFRSADFFADSDIPADQIDDGAMSDEPADDEAADVEPVAVTEFAYSGEIDTPDFQWPAAPEQPTLPAAPEEPSPIEAPEHLVAETPVDQVPVAAEAVVEDRPAEQPVEAGASEGNADLAELVAAATRFEDEIDPEPALAADQIDLAPDADTLGDAIPPGVDIGIPAAEWFRGGSPDEELEPVALDPAPAALQTEPIDGSGTDGDDEDAEDEPIRVNGTHRPLPSPFADRASLSAAEYADAPLAPIIDLRDVATTTGSGIETAIRSGEVEVISALIEQGMLSTNGPISDRDVRTMVYVAFTSNELRKLLLAGGSPEGPNPGLDLGPVELFSEGIEAPKTFYPGLPMQTEARSQLG